MWICTFSLHGGEPMLRSSRWHHPTGPSTRSLILRPRDRTGARLRPAGGGRDILQAPWASVTSLRQPSPSRIQVLRSECVNIHRRSPPSLPSERHISFDRRTSILDAGTALSGCHISFIPHPVGTGFPSLHERNYPGANRDRNGIEAHVGRGTPDRSVVLAGPPEPDGPRGTRPERPGPGPEGPVRSVTPRDRKSRPGRRNGHEAPA
jgi:hypothetical protein